MSIRWHSRAELVHHIVTLTRDGMSRRAIARSLDVSRNTIRAVLAAHTAEREVTPHSVLPEPPARAPRAKKVDGFERRIAELFARYPDITAQRVFEILKDEGFNGGYTAIKKHVRKVPSAKEAGAQSHDALVRTGRDGRERLVAFHDQAHERRAARHPGLRLRP